MTTRSSGRGPWLGLWLVTLALLLLVMGLSTGFDFRWLDFGTGDYLAYWSVPRALLFGHGMYNQIWLEGIHRALDFPGYEFSTAHYPVMPLWNPPPIVLLLLPFGALGFTGATMLWTFIGLGLFGHAVLLFNRMLRDPLPEPIALWVALLFIPAALAAYWGQPTPLLLACLIYAWRAQRHGNALAAGILILPVLLKPQLFTVVLTLMMVVALRRRQWALPIALGGGVLVLTTLLTALDPGWLEGFRSQGISRAQTFSFWDAATYFMGLPDWVQILSIPAGGLVGLVRYHRVDRITPSLLGEASLLSVLFSPYLWTHDVIVLLPAALWLSARLWARGGRFFIVAPALLWVFPYFSLEALRPTLESTLAVGHRWLALLAPSVDGQVAIRFYVALGLYVMMWGVATLDLRPKSLGDAIAGEDE